MATSPIYSWPEPDNTDLVKNGALAIRTLGNAIDTTMGTMVAKTIVDAKGDLIAATAADTVARLAVGTDGQTLVADSSTATGLRYQTGYNGNAIINGGMDIWQRGTTFTTTSGVAYTADRWSSWTVSAGGSVTTSRQTVSDTTNLPTIQYATKFLRVAGNTNTGILNYFYTAESADSYRFAGQTVTLSFYAKKGANYSAASNILVSGVVTGTGTDQRMYDFTSKVEQNQNNTLTTTWQRFTQTVTVAATATEVGVQFYLTPVGTAGADDSFSITGVQLELGSVATTFKRSAGGSIQGELAACQRYYNRFTAPEAYSHFAQGWAISTDNMTAWFYLPVEMRVVPTTIDYASVNMGDGVNAQVTPSTITFTSANNNTKAIACTGTKSAGGMTQYRGYQFLAAGTTAAYIGFSAEL